MLVNTQNGIEARMIQVGLANDQSTEVVDGLRDGEDVVLPINPSLGVASPGAARSP